MSDSKKSKSEIKTKQSFKEVVSNNWFFLKLIFQASPVFVILFALDAIRHEVSIFFEHTIGIGYILEAAEFNYPFKHVAAMILLLAACVTLGMVFTVIVGDYVGEIAKPKIRKKIKMMLYEKARILDLNCYDNPEFYNEQVLAISEVDNQIDRVLQFVKDTLCGITALLTSTFFMLAKDKISVIFAVVSFILQFICAQVYNKLHFKSKMEAVQPSRKRDYIKRVFYLIDYAKEIRLNPNVSATLMDEFDDANDDVYKVEKKYANKKFVMGFLKGFATSSLVTDFIYVGYLVFQAAVRHVLAFSTVAILFGRIGSLKAGLRVFTETYPFASETSLYVGRIRKFLSYEPQIVSEKNLTPSEGAKEMELKDVSFSYDKTGERKLISNLNLHIRPGEKIALVGYNGAGKTTLVKLLMRLYDVNSGEIKADGINIKDYNLKAYRETIGTVFQDFQIFAGSITENVLLDVSQNTDESLAKVSDALADSGLLPRVKTLKNGLDTELTTEFSEEGVNLSGGESQKLAIARVFYKDSGLMILDEPSSALDPIAEYQLNHAMLEATKDKTVIFISHRLSTTRLADRIIMLENGSIVEEGSHEELLKADGSTPRCGRFRQALISQCEFLESSLRWF